MIKNETVLKILRDEIENLLKVNSEIEYIIVSTYDGIPIASNVSTTAEETILASIAAIAKSLGEKINQMIPSGELKYILFHYSEKKIMVLSFEKFDVLAIAKEGARTGILMRDLIAFAEKTKKYLMGL